MYKAYDLCIKSDVPLPELVQSTEDSIPDLCVKEGRLTVPRNKLPETGGYIWENEEGIYFNWNRIGTFLLKEDREIIVDRKSGVPDEAVRLPLLGCILGVLLHRRGFFTLHASASVIEGEAIAFVGYKGAGKSTIAAAIHEQGHSLIADDVLALSIDEDGTVYALPGFPQCKLWPASAIALGQDPADLAQLHPELEKRALRPTSGIQKTAVPLKQIYVLYEDYSVGIEQLPLKEAFMEVFKNQYAPRFLGETGDGLRLFQQCQALVDSVPVFGLRRPKEFSRLPEVLAMLEDNVLQLKSWQV